ncbi:MAG: peptidyl-prolyl cis-trans isomerase [Candidatus Coatesbacteria bacterium]|nr:MAG: peptidyl-prolyl cis-trans isomerase [Candidatus Coatesbacteria bacterium]
MVNSINRPKFVVISSSSAIFLVAVLFGCGGVNPDKPIVTIDGEYLITAGDYLYRYHRAVDKAEPGEEPVIDTFDDAQSFLDGLIIGRVLEIEAEARGYGDDPVLQRDVITHRQETMYDMLYEDVLVEITVTNEDVREYYNRKTRPRYASLIATKTEKRAEEAKKALDSGRSFEEVVGEFSDDRLTRGIGGKIQEPMMYRTAPVYDAIFDLEDKGDYTDVIYHEFYDMYFIYKYDGDADRIELDYEAEKGNLRGELENYKVNNAISESVDKLRDGAEVERNEGVYNDVFSLSVAEVGEKHFNPITIIATVNGTPVYFDDFWDYFVYKLKFSGTDPDAFRESDTKQFKNTVEKALDFFVRETLIEAVAARRGLTEREDFVREMNRFRGGKLADRMYEKVVIPTVPKVTDEEINAYYEGHKEDYALPETMKGAFILLKDRGLLEELHKEALSADFKTAADKAYGYLLAKYGVTEPGGRPPDDARETVAKFDVTAEPADDRERPYDAILRKHVFDYPEGTISPVIEVGDGRFLVFRNREHTPYTERILTDPEVHAAVKRDAQAEIMLSPETDRKCREWLDDFKGKHEIVIDEKVLNAVFEDIQKKKG